jgi:tetratricopeptide (TPR) repeat protein
MTRPRLLLAAAAALVAAAVAALGGVLAGEPAAQSDPRDRTVEESGRLVQGFSAGDTAALVERLLARVEADPGDAEGLTLLGLAYQQRARETADSAYYPRAEEALRRAVSLRDADYLTFTGLAALAASRHRFADARRLAERAIRLNPASAEARGILGDALVELGRYREAFDAFERMASLKPGLAAYARISYARELLGRTRAAVKTMELAVRAGAGNAENAAWTLVQLGNLDFDTGRPLPAERAYREALARYPGYVKAQAGLARVEAARGRWDAAVGLYRRALDAVPLPEYAVGLAETLAAAGRDREARDAYRLVAVIQRVFAANGVRTDLETALVDLDRGRDVHGALARAREAYDERRSIEAEDVLAWALLRNGHCHAARRHSERALRLGTHDALKLFHRAAIEECLGRPAAARSFAARALAANPQFSLRYAGTARELAR